MTPQVRRFVSGLAQLEDRLLVLLDLQSLLEADAFELPDALSAQPEDRPATTA
jgi:chemotaxis signal transduction protein